MANRHVPTPSILEFPELGDTPDSVKLYLRFVAKQVISGALDHVVGRELGQLAKTYLVVLKHEHDVSEFERLKDLVRQAEALSQAGTSREVAERQHSRLLPAANGTKQKTTP